MAGGRLVEGVVVGEGICVAVVCEVGLVEELHILVAGITHVEVVAARRTPVLHTGSVLHHAAVERTAEHSLHGQVACGAGSSGKGSGSLNSIGCAGFPRYGSHGSGLEIVAFLTGEGEHVAVDASSPCAEHTHLDGHVVGTEVVPHAVDIAVHEARVLNRCHLGGLQDDATEVVAGDVVLQAGCILVAAVLTVPTVDNLAVGLQLSALDVLLTAAGRAKQLQTHRILESIDAGGVDPDVAVVVVGELDKFPAYAVVGVARVAEVGTGISLRKGMEIHR